MLMNLRSLVSIGAVAAVISLVAVACSSTASSPGAVPSIAVPTALPSIAIPSIAIPSIAIPSGLGSFVIPSFSLPEGDKDLEARLPNQINGVTLTKVSFKGADFLNQGGGNDQTVLDFLTSLGKKPDDLSAAFASDPSGNLDVMVGAFRVAGADSNTLLTQFVNATKKDRPSDTVQQTNLGGKNVTQINDPTDTTTGSLYIYPNGDTLFYAQSSDPNLAAAGLQALP
jgi:hypothetical protein